MGRGPQLRLNTLEATKKTFNKVIRQYYRDELPDPKARTLGYLLTGVLQYWKLIADLRIEEELEDIREWIKEHKNAS